MTPEEFDKIEDLQRQLASIDKISVVANHDGESDLNWTLTISGKVIIPGSHHYSTSNEMSKLAKELTTHIQSKFAERRAAIVATLKELIH